MECSVSLSRWALHLQNSKETTCGIESGLKHVLIQMLGYQGVGGWDELRDWD